VCYVQAQLREVQLASAVSFIKLKPLPELLESEFATAAAS